MESSVYLLDCTLRDGGYINNWEFGEAAFDHILSGLAEAGIPLIECGIMGEGAPGSTKFPSMEAANGRLAGKKRPECRYSVILNYSDHACLPLPERAEDGVDIIRLAFFKQECPEAVAYAGELMQKGYAVFLQAMATSRYSETELAALVELVNGRAPEAFYLVDSFGTMFHDDIEAHYHFINSRLDPAVRFGLHAHNNQQMAVSNAIHFMELAGKRCIAVDVSVYGMGRGAGNANTEILMNYMNRKQGAHYGSQQIIELYERDLKPIYERLHWGYSADYLVSALKDANPAYVWYLTTRHGITDAGKLARILDRIPFLDRHSLNKEAAEEAAAWEKENRHEG